MPWVLCGRLKSSLERAQRLTQSFTDGLLAVLPERADTFGRALGIQDERIQVQQPPHCSSACLLTVRPSLACLQAVAHCCITAGTMCMWTRSLLRALMLRWQCPCG